MAYKKSNPNGQATMANSEPVAIASNQSAVPVSFTGSGDVATQTTLSAINAKLVTGTDIGDVTINNGTGASAVNIQDGGNAITVDGAVTVTNGTATNFKAEVVGTGTFATQATLAAETTKVIGVTRTADGSGNLLSSTTNALDVNIKSGTVTTHPVTVASGGIASGAIASGAIAAGAIAAGNTSIATTEDTARAAGEHLVKVGVSRLDTPVANANVSTDGDYTNIIVDNFGKIWTSGSVPEDTAHVAGEAILQNGVRRIDTPATSAGSSGDWATMDASAEGALWVTTTPTTTGGLSTFMASGSDGSSILVATAQVIKATSGNLYGYYAYNPETAVSFVHFYNTAAASVTVGTTSPLFTIAIPGGAAANLMFPYPVTFSNAGWSCAATTTAGGNTAPATGVSLVAWYK